MIKKILVANRGEIALRVIRSARELGIATVAVYSAADRRALHVRMADEAYYVGPAPSNQSYLNVEAILEAAKKSGADAIHPGYGFLSENATFSAAVEKAGLIFIGPSASSIEIMGDKLASKAAVSGYGVPMVPGMQDAVASAAEAKKYAAEIGYPVLIKASAGGGGKGMRIVERPEELENDMQRAMSEASSAFGNPSVFVEKYITSPRHVEIQILGDQHGNTVYLFERECSVQRRHQKVVEEAPSAIVTPELRKKMGQSAVNVAKACNYYGAGTVEFLVDADRNFYFLEMNTRLQVEHPITEMITGLDLVKEQIHVANGGRLRFSQDELEFRGHAIELRVYAEDPTNNFLPDIGKLTTYRRPQGPGVRVDDGYEEGMEIPIYYDPMIAKLVASGSSREEAIQRMIRAIDEYQISGVQTTLGFGKFVMQHEAFISGNYDTRFIQQYFKPDSLEDYPDKEEEIAAAMAANLMKREENASSATTAGGNKSSRWKQNRL